MSDDLNIEITLEEDRPEQATACVFDVVAMDQIGASLGKMLPKVAGWLEEGHGEMAGPPYARYHPGPDGKMDVEAGVPVAGHVAGDGTVQAGMLPGGRCAVATFHGPYDQMPKAHQRLQQWVADNGEQLDGAPWEMYVTDPMEEKDSSKWETIIVHPLKAR